MLVLYQSTDLWLSLAPRSDTNKDRLVDPHHLRSPLFVEVELPLNQSIMVAKEKGVGGSRVKIHKARSWKLLHEQ